MVPLRSAQDCVGSAIPAARRLRRSQVPPPGSHTNAFLSAAAGLILLGHLLLIVPMLPSGLRLLIPMLLLAGCVYVNPAPMGAQEEAVAEAERAFADAAAREGIRDAFVRFASDSAIAFRPEPASARESWRSRGPVTGRLSWYPVYVRA